GSSTSEKRRLYVLTCPVTDPPTTALFTLSLHDALPISIGDQQVEVPGLLRACDALGAIEVLAQPLNPDPPLDQPQHIGPGVMGRSEEHTSELQSRSDLVCRLLLEKKNPPCPPSSF